MHTEARRDRRHVRAIGGRAHSVHFLVGEPCSRTFTWFRRRPDQRVIGPVLGLGTLTDALIPFFGSERTRTL